MYEKWQKMIFLLLSFKIAIQTYDEHEIIAFIQKMLEDILILKNVHRWVSENGEAHIS